MYADVILLFQTEVCSGALTDVIHAVINGTDGCLFCFGHARLGDYSFLFSVVQILVQTGLAQYIRLVKKR
jgi:hypothetical protein